MKLSLRSILPARDLGWNRVRAACALPECHNKLLTKYVPGSRTGIFVGESWYCSPDCFAQGSRKTLAAFSSGCVVEMPRNPRLSLGLALVSKGLITEDQYREAVIRSQCRAEALETTLLDCGFASEKKLAAGRAAQWGYPALVQELSGPIVEADLPSSLLRAHRAAPIHYSAKSKRLVLGFVDRVEHGLLQSIEQITGCRAEPCFITPAEFAEQMERVTAAPEYEEVVVDEPETATQMGRTLAGWAVEISAREASFAKCNSFAWVRMAGKRGTVDVIFSLKHASVAANTKLSAIVPEVTVNLG
jgi:Type II secretion system (T2SS), protein E, N-terminal domain